MRAKEQVYIESCWKKNSPFSDLQINTDGNENNDGIKRMFNVNNNVKVSDLAWAYTWDSMIILSLSTAGLKMRKLFVTYFLGWID